MSDTHDFNPAFIVEDYESLSDGIYKYTLRDTKTGEAIAPLTAQQGKDMKLLLQSWFIVKKAKQ